MGVYGNLNRSGSEGLLDFPFAAPISPIEGSPTKVRGLDGWPDDVYPRNIVYRVSMLETALSLCREGLAVAYLPKFLVKLHNETVKREFQLLELEIPRRMSAHKTYVYLIKRKSDIENAVIKRLARAIRKICR